MKNLTPSAPDSQPISTHVANGRLAKGAKSPEGLARSARNATKHGLSGRSFCHLSNEDPQEFEAVRAQYLAAFNPRDTVELNFVNQFVEAYWLQQRCALFISQTLSQEISEQRQSIQHSAPGLTEMDLAVYASATLHDRSHLIQTYERYHATHTRNMLRFHSALIRHRAAFGATASLPASGDSSSPQSMFLPGLIGTPAVATKDAPTLTESTNYETNPTSEPRPQGSGPDLAEIAPPPQSQATADPKALVEDAPAQVCETGSTNRCVPKPERPA